MRSSHLFEKLGMRRPSRRLALVLVAATVLLGACLGGGNLSVLLADPLASAEIESGFEQRRHDRDDGETLGKPIYAGVTRVFEAKLGNTTSDVMAELAATAEQLEWAVERSDRGFKATKTTESQPLEVSANFLDEDSVVLNFRMGRTAAG